MARLPKDFISRIYGIEGSTRWDPYKDLNEVLNIIGIMAKRDKIPYARVIIPPSKVKTYYYEDMEYYAPNYWRDCLYEDLETGDYYIISPDPKNKNYPSNSVYSWIAFKVTGLTDGIRYCSRDDSGKRTKEILYHSGSFIDLIKRCNLNEVLDTLAKNQKPIVIKVLRRLYSPEREDRGAVCQFDI